MHLCVFDVLAENAKTITICFLLEVFENHGKILHNMYLGSNGPKFCASY